MPIFPMNSSGLRTGQKGFAECLFLIPCKLHEMGVENRWSFLHFCVSTLLAIFANGQTLLLSQNKLFVTASPYYQLFLCQYSKSTFIKGRALSYFFYRLWTSRDKMGSKKGLMFLDADFNKMKLPQDHWLIAGWQFEQELTDKFINPESNSVQIL